jgi:ABC-type amino acid transport substrate-binding protein
MKKKLRLGLSVILIAVVMIGPVLADQTMDRIQKTGVIKVGFRDGSLPFAFRNPETDRHAGFSVDMAAELAKYLSLRFEKTIAIKPFSVTPTTRIQMVADGTIDVEMGATTYKQEREERVDFSMIFFVSDTAFLVARDSNIKALEDLNGKRVGATQATTNLKALARVIKEGKLSLKELVVGESHSEGMQALQSGKIDAYCTDGSLLEGLRLRAQHPGKWAITPFGIDYEPYAYMCQEGQSDFRDFINSTISWTIKTGRFFEMYDKWMGSEGMVNIPISDAYRNYLNIMAASISDEWWKK